MPLNTAQKFKMLSVYRSGCEEKWSKVSFEFCVESIPLNRF